MSRPLRVAVVVAGYGAAIAAAVVAAWMYNARVAALPYDTSGGDVRRRRGDVLARCLPRRRTGADAPGALVPPQPREVLESGSGRVARVRRGRSARGADAARDQVDRALRARAHWAVGTRAAARD